MKFARFWRSTQIEVAGRFGRTQQITVWGASGEDAEAASADAAARAARVKAFFSDRRAEYEYANEYIREDVIEELVDDAGALLAVVTRNRYGALVLNTERVMFGDIDLPRENIVLRVCNRLGRRPRDKRYYLARIRGYQAAHPEHSFVVYETRAGLRFVLAQRESSPDAADVETLFGLLGVDRLYRRLCRSQRCFRARLTAKPWRIGLTPPPQRFPFAGERERRSFDFWLQQYLERSRNTCAARLLETIGPAARAPSVSQVLALHDRYACDADAELA